MRMKHPLRHFLSMLFLLGPSAFAGDGFFTPPESPIPLNAGPVHQVDLAGGSADEAQKLIDATRREHPGEWLMLNAKGDLIVSGAPLRLDSRTVLKLSPKAGVKAGAACSAPALISIADAGQVTVCSSGPGLAVISGGGKASIGISVTAGKLIAFDQLNVTGCTRTGIHYRGNDAAAVNEAGSVTRCQFQANGDGLDVAQTAAFMGLDNQFLSQTGTALAIDSVTSIVAGNSFTANRAGIVSSSARGVLTRNSLNDRMPLELTPASTGNLVTENRGKGAGARLLLGGSGNRLFRNSLSGKVAAAPGSRDNLLLSNDSLSFEKPSPAVKIFNPPSLQDTRPPEIIPGMGRWDLKFASTATPLDLASVGEAITKARADHPNDVLVATLAGQFISHLPDGLQLPPNTCLILKGKITAECGLPSDPEYNKASPLTQVIRLPKSGFCSVVGGTLNAGKQVFFPLNANTGALALIEGVTLTGGQRDGLNTKGRGGAGALFVNHCNVPDNKGRGIWSHVASGVTLIGNTCTNNRLDGIDFDAYSSKGIALFNSCSGNKRHGIFVEEAISGHILFANTLNVNGNAGVHVWNQEVKGNTGLNVIAANTCKYNRRGTSVGGRATDKTANGNLFFNNVCLENWLNDLMPGNRNATGNEFIQCVVGKP